MLKTSNLISVGTVCDAWTLKPKTHVVFETNEELLFTEAELMAHSLLRIADYRIYSGEVEGQNDAWLHVQNEQNLNLSQCATLF